MKFIKNLKLTTLFHCLLSIKTPGKVFEVKRSKRKSFSKIKQRKTNKFFKIYAVVFLDW